ncbi:RHS repeat protein [Vibrio navarrensis]|uniref:RHS repeat protein n=1 Tax=Vibrio navarrensis TaxID=29495 RepID=UPI001558B9B0|nr:RHS repeat protein [Vibrio navarrensis]
MNEYDIGQLCQGTPTITVLDNRGLTVREVQFNRTRTSNFISDLDTRITRHTYNSAGHLQSSIDPRFFTQLESATTPEDKAQVPNNFNYLTSLSGTQLRIDSIDAGARMSLLDVTGAPYMEWDERGTTRRFEYEDVLHRPTAVIEQNDAINNGVEQVTERFVYGDNEPDAADSNLNGQLVRHYDNAGLCEVSNISLTGQPLSETRRLLLSDTGDSDWQGTVEAEWKTQLEPDVANKRYTTGWLYNALGEVLQQTDAMGNLQRTAYHVSGRLQASYLTLAGEGQAEQTVVSELEYSAHGQKVRETAGNGVITEYTYDEKNLRLIRVKTTRPAKANRPTLLQDLRYSHDPVGNILSIEDQSVATRFYKNQQVSAENYYEYDALYQLTKATGRENDGNGQQSSSFPTLKVPLPSDSSQYINYTRTYRYDRGGNLEQVQHHGATQYTNTLVVSDRSNRAVQQNDHGSITPEQVDSHFDVHGNLKQLARSKALGWGRRDQLKQVDITAQQQEHYQYSAQGTRIRKTLRDQANNQQQQVTYLAGLELRRKYGTGQSLTTLTEDLHVLTLGEAGRAQVRLQHWAAGKPADETDIPDNQLRYSLDNHLGSSNLELDQDADMITREEYYPFGGTAVWSAKSQTEAKYKTIRYSGKEMDATGLYYYGYRYYASWMGRWLNPDPAWTVDGLNLYWMVTNNPSTHADIDGLMKGGETTVAKRLPVTKQDWRAVSTTGFKDSSDKKNSIGEIVAVRGTIGSKLNELHLKLDPDSAATIYAGDPDNVYGGILDISSGTIYAVPLQSRGDTARGRRRDQFPTVSYSKSFKVNKHEYSQDKAVRAVGNTTMHENAVARIQGKSGVFDKKTNIDNYIGFSFSTEISGDSHGASYAMYSFHSRSRSLNESKNPSNENATILASDYEIEYSYKSHVLKYKSTHESYYSTRSETFGNPVRAAKGTLSQSISNSLQRSIRKGLVRYGKANKHPKLPIMEALWKPYASVY